MSAIFSTGRTCFRSCVCVGFLPLLLTSPMALAGDVLDITPQQVTLTSPFARAQLQVRQPSAAASAESLPDLTHLARYRSSRPEVASVGATGQVVALADGEAVIEVVAKGVARSVPVRVSGVGASPRIQFDDTIPHILSKAGCNAGACHASQYGQGSFKLSVFSSELQADHKSMASAAVGRRVNLLDPANSLLLLKPNGSLPHGGGLRLERGSVDHQVLERWIACGAPGPRPKVLTKLTNLEVVPARRTGTGDFTQQLRVVAVHDDGSRRDVTHWARYDSLDESVLRVTAQGQVQVFGKGQGTAMARFGGFAAIMQVVVPFGPTPNLESWKENNFIDHLAAAKFRQLGLTPAPLCDDGTFLRRAFLDAIGTLPSVDEARRFADSIDPDKRRKVVERLLGLTGDPAQDVHNDSYAAWWGLRWADLLRSSSKTVGEQQVWALHNWLQASFRENKRFDAFVRELITARGSTISNGPANFFTAFSTVETRTEAVSQVFLGIRMQCAQCHHHPFESISQGDFYGLAAFFARVGTKSLQDFGVRHYNTDIIVLKKGDVRHPRTGIILSPTPLHSPPATEGRDRRLALADWIAAPANPFFARNIANRYWAHCMGRGLVEPVDDLRATNPASNPELLDALADEFIRGGYDVKHLLRTIMTSRLYQLDSIAPPAACADGRFYTSFRTKRVHAEPLSDAIDAVTGVPTHFKGVPFGTRAIELPDAKYDDYPLLETFGKPKREGVCECDRVTEANLSQALHTLNSATIFAKITDPKGRLGRLLAAKAAHESVVDELYLAALARRPTPDEQAACRRLAAQAPTPQSFYEDLLWSLINSKHFLFVR